MSGQLRQVYNNFQKSEMGGSPHHPLCQALKKYIFKLTMSGVVKFPTHLYFNIQRREKYSLATGQVWDVTSHKCQIHADLKHYVGKSLFAMDRWRYKQFLDVPLIIVFF